MKNKLLDLNNHLFEQLERLNDDSLTGDRLKEEINRSKAMGGVATCIVANATLALEAQKAIGVSLKEGQLPGMISAPALPPAQ